MTPEEEAERDAFIQSVRDRAEAEAYKISSDMMMYGTGYMKDGKHVPFADVQSEDDYDAAYGETSVMDYVQGKSPAPQLPAFIGVDPAQEGEERTIISKWRDGKHLDSKVMVSTPRFEESFIQRIIDASTPPNRKWCRLAPKPELQDNSEDQLMRDLKYARDHFSGLAERYESPAPQLPEVKWLNKPEPEDLEKQIPFFKDQLK